LELNAGIIEGDWTPLAAKQASWAVAHLTPKESEELFEMLGNRTPSNSTLDRLPKALNTHWEAHRLSFESQLREEESVPAEAVSIGVSLDGVRVPMKDGDRKGKREQAKAQGKSPSGPSGYPEVGCGPISFYDRYGERLLTRRMGRMPESHQATLKSQRTAEVMRAWIERPGLKVVKLADGAPDHWTYLSDFRERRYQPVVGTPLRVRLHARWNLHYPGLRTDGWQHFLPVTAYAVPEP
jgi:hypothetical protein